MKFRLGCNLGEDTKNHLGERTEMEGMAVWQMWSSEEHTLWGWVNKEAGKKSGLDRGMKQESPGYRACEHLEEELRKKVWEDRSNNYSHGKFQA